MLTTSFIVSLNHPSLPGHFPGHSIAPGVVILDYVARGLISQLSDVTLNGFPQVKFLKPVLPDMVIIVTYKIRSEFLYQFVCEENGNKLLTGQIRLYTEINAPHG